MKLFKLNWNLRKLVLLVAGTSLFTIATFSQAGTLVRINTSLGGVTLELFDEDAPNTVANFLNYVNSGRYDGTFIHRSEPDFVIQGGWLTFDEDNNTLNAIPVDPNIPNEFKLSNTRGTVAMAKVAGDPDSASSQWFVNLADNTGLDSDNGGYTVFGRIVDNGMAVIDAIAALPRVTLTQGLSPTPLIGFVEAPLRSAHLVNLTMSVMANTSSAPNIYDGKSGVLYTTIDAGPVGVPDSGFFSALCDTGCRHQGTCIQRRCILTRCQHGDLRWQYRSYHHPGICYQRRRRLSQCCF